MEGCAKHMALHSHVYIAVDAASSKIIINTLDAAASKNDSYCNTRTSCTKIQNSE